MMVDILHDRKVFLHSSGDKFGERGRSTFLPEETGGNGKIAIDKLFDSTNKSVCMYVIAVIQYYAMYVIAVILLYFKMLLL